MQFKGTCTPATGQEDRRSPAPGAHTVPEAVHPEKEEEARETLAIGWRHEVAASGAAAA